MNKATLVSTIFVVSAAQASADSAHTHDLSKLSPDVSARVIELEKHGDRFDAVIHGILAEASKPTWTFDDNAREPVANKQDEPES